MATKTLTDKMLAREHRLDTERIEIWDTIVPGFGVRITAKGSKTFFLMTRVNGKRSRITLGKYPILKLAEARESARKALERVHAGQDPRASRSSQALTMTALVADFDARHLSKLRPASQRAARQLLNDRILSRYANRAPDSITRAEISALLDDIAAEGKATTANRTLAAVRKLFNWAVERGELDVSPCNGVKAPATEVQRDRFLTMDEVAAIWNSAGRLSAVHAGFVKMLLLTGQRRASVAQMRRSQITNGVWTIPRENMKGGRAHTVPLPAIALDIIESLPAIGETGDLVFTHDGDRAIAGFSKLKRALDTATGVTDWRLHDLRRTAGTHIARLGFPRLVISKILGHNEGGVTQIYELHSYDTEKRRALHAWADEITAAAEGRDNPSNVIKLKG